MQNDRKSQFIASYGMESYPLARASHHSKARYMTMLEYFVSKFAVDAEYASARLMQYRKMLIGDGLSVVLTDGNRDRVFRSVVSDWMRPWKRHYFIWLMCDLATILTERRAIEQAQAAIDAYLSKKKRVLLGNLVSALFTDEPVRKELQTAEYWIRQYRTNRIFASQPEMRILVTANMSAGKSTLINALIGKNVARTSQEACTANLSYLFNKPVEDNAVHLRAGQLKLNATYDELMNIGPANSSYVASYFRTFLPSGSPRRICLIDTPGVNSAMNPEHGNRTRKALLEEQYDRLLFVLHGGRIGIDEELSYLKYVSEHVPKEKIVFVLNKVDDFRRGEDDVATSIEGIRADLRQLGFENPILYPISAYFGLLLKQKQNGERLIDDEQDAYDLFVKKFSRPEFDMSAYANISAPTRATDQEQPSLAARCGLYALETILFGGTANEERIHQVQPL